MKKNLHWIFLAIVTLWVLSSLRPPKNPTEINTRDFARLPVLLGGRIQPMDSMARNSLLTMSGKQYIRLENKTKITAREWLMDTFMNPEKADTYPIFRVQHPDVIALIDDKERRLPVYSLDEIRPNLDKIEEQARHISETKKEAQLRTAFEKDLVHLYDSVILYHRLKNSFHPEAAHSFQEELDAYREAIPPGIVAIRASEAGQPFETNALQRMVGFFKRYQNVARFSYALAVPPLPGDPDEKWQNVGECLMKSMATGEIHPVLGMIAKMSSAYKANEAATFNGAVAEYQKWLQERKLTAAVQKGSREFFFNHMDPFGKSMALYVLALILGCLFWLNISEPVRKSAVVVLAAAFIVHSIGLCFRMFLEGRPPVTNLYSSAVFVGWGAVLLGLILERIYREGIGIVTAAAVGFCTQLIAYHLARGGDTMQMLQAVLDTNFWLATHVVVITIGYAAMFLAGFLAIVYIVRGLFTRGLGANTAKSLARMVYGIVCFATLFSFVGTVLGGIWADQSWGRFWGWDPKENGALLIVIWCAVILHARWGGMIRDRGLMAAAIFGNIVTAFSWFGVNMLGVGLHSYGFMDKAFFWLMLFNVTQLAFIALAFVPQEKWRSFQKPGRPLPKAPEQEPLPA